MTFYSKHMFFCINQKDNGRKCCQDNDANSAVDFAKEMAKNLGIIGGNRGVRISSSGCLGRCGKGPSIVIYPDNVWYSYSSLEDVKKIITDHLVNNKVVTELLMD